MLSIQKKTKDYGIMALLAHSQTHPSGLIPFPFAFSALPAPCYCFLFSVFFLGKSYAERKRSRTATFEDWKEIQNDCIIIKFKNYGT